MHLKGFFICQRNQSSHTTSTHLLYLCLEHCFPSGILVHWNTRFPLTNSPVIHITYCIRHAGIQLFLPSQNKTTFFFFFIMLCPKASTPFLGSLLQQTPQTFSCFHMNPLTSTSNVNIVTLWSIFCFHLSWPSSSIWHS